MADAEHSSTTSQFSVSVIIEHALIEHRQWTVPRWRLIGFIAGEAIGTERGRRCVHEEAGVRQELWHGFSVRLDRQSAESYWHNLKSANPSLFLVCREDPDEGLIPFSVTADYDEAAAHMESDDSVFSGPMPPEIYRWLEDYVVMHYRPEPPRRRRRKNWAEETADEQGTGN